MQKRQGMYKVSVLFILFRRSCNFFIGRYKLDNSKSRVQWKLARFHRKGTGNRGISLHFPANEFRSPPGNSFFSREGRAAVASRSFAVVIFPSSIHNIYDPLNYSSRHQLPNFHEGVYHPVSARSIVAPVVCQKPYLRLSTVPTTMKFPALF